MKKNFGGTFINAWNDQFLLGAGKCTNRRECKDA